MTKEEAYKILCEFNLWRRGKGKYKWIPTVPSANPTFPYSPKEVGEALDVAIAVLKKEVSK